MKRIGIVICLLLLVSTASASQYFVARGDSISIPEEKPGGTCWFFPATGTGTLYDIPAKVGINTTYCTLTSADTSTMSITTYTLLYQEPAFINNKYFKDVSWVNNKLVSSFSHTESIDESGRQGSSVLTDLQKIISDNGFNTFTIDQVVLQVPTLTIRGITQTGENTYTAYGTSNYENNTQITLKINPERNKALHDDSFTYYSKIIRDPQNEIGQWTAGMLMPVQEMPAGWQNLSVFVNGVETTARFKLDEQEWAPEPTPTRYVKYLSNGDIEPDKIYINTTIVQVVTQDVWHTATPTPAILDALGDEITYPYDRGGTFENVWIYCMAGGFAGLVILVVIMRRWKKE